MYGGARTLGPVCGVVSTLQLSGSGHLQDWFHTPPSVCLPHPFHTDSGSAIPSTLYLNLSHLLILYGGSSTPLHPFAYHTPFILTMEVL